MMAAGGQRRSTAAIEIIRSVGTGTTPKAMFSPQLARSVWQDYTGTAERYNEPGRFTALIGYEWTSNNGGNNLHRVVIFRDGKDKADQIVPFSAFDSEDPAMLWKFLDAYQDEDRRRGARHPAQRQPLQRPHVRAGRLRRARPDARLRRDAGAARAGLRGDADQGRRRGAPVPVAERRVRRLRALGQGQSRPDRAEEARDAAIRVCPLRARSSGSSWSRNSASTRSSSA